MLHFSGIKAAGDKTFALFALFADYKDSVFSVPSVANYFNDPDITSRAMYVGAALAANGS